MPTVSSGEMVKLPEPSTLSKKNQNNKKRTVFIQLLIGPSQHQSEHQGSRGRTASRPLLLDEFQHLR